MKQVGVFDSGIGGAEFAKALGKVHPGLELEVVHDNKNMPYGSKSPETIQLLVDAAIQPLLGKDVVVLACNTATAYAIDFLRNKYPQQEFIGFEPAIKVAAEQTKTKCIAILATPATLSSPRYRSLKQRCGENLEIIEPDVSSLAHEIEQDGVNWELLQRTITKVVSENVDTIVLGCTHYHLIEGEIQKFAGNDVAIVTPTNAVIKRIEKILGL